MTASDTTIATSTRLQDIFWNTLVQLKVDCEYTRLYRDHLNAMLIRFAIMRAVVSVSALGTWAVVQAYPGVWGTIIVLSQVAEAVERAIPFTARAQGTAALLVSLDAMMIDSQMDWETIFAGRLGEQDLIRRLHALMSRRHEADTKNLPNGLPSRPRFLRLAEGKANAYFRRLYGIGREP